MRADPPASTSTALARPLPQTPANVARYVEVLGHDGAVQVLLAFGGGRVEFSRNPDGSGALEAAIGRENVSALGAALGYSVPICPPLANRRLARMLGFHGHTATSMSRQLRVSETTTRRYVREPLFGGGRGCPDLNGHATGTGETPAPGKPRDRHQRMAGRRQAG